MTVSNSTEWHTVAARSTRYSSAVPRFPHAITPHPRPISRRGNSFYYRKFCQRRRERTANGITSICEMNPREIPGPLGAKRRRTRKNNTRKEKGKSRREILKSGPTRAYILHVRVSRKNKIFSVLSVSKYEND